MSNTNNEPFNSADRLRRALGSFVQGKTAIDNILSLVGHSFEKKSKAAPDLQRLAFEVVIELHQLHLQFLEDMETAPINEAQRSAMLSGLKSITRMITPDNLYNPSPLPSEAELSLLSICATFLEVEQKATTDELQELAVSIAELKQRINETGISPTLKKVLSEFIRLSEDSIARYKIHGAKGLKRAFKQMLAESADLMFGATAEQKQEIKSTSAWSSITKHLKKFDSVAAKLLKYQPVIENITKTLFIES